MTHCPAYQGPICSLCCSLDARCHDLCKPEASLAAQWNTLLRRLLPASAVPYLETGLGHYLLLMTGIVPVLALVLGVLYTHERPEPRPRPRPKSTPRCRTASSRALPPC
jgi:hypothetical protein